MEKYLKQAEKFLQETKTSFKVEFIRNDLYFPEDTGKRDVYNVTLARGERSYTFTFGQSVSASGRFVVYDNPSRGMSRGVKSGKKGNWYRPIEVNDPGKWGKNKNFAEPTAYDVLACLQKHPVEDTYKEFAEAFGYGEDSIKGLNVYKAVKDEYNRLCMLYSDEELKDMGEIQ